MAGFELFTPVFNEVDQVTSQYVSQMSQAAAVTLAPVATVGLTLTFMLFGLLIARGAVQMPISEFIGKSIKIGAICGVALVGGVYQTDIAEIIQTLPDELATVLLPSTAKGQTAAALIDKAGQGGFDKVSEAWSHVEVPWGESLVWVLVSVVILVATVGLLAIGGSLLLLAKLALAVVAGVGPLFILALLWQPTTRLFEAWTGQVITYTVLTVIMSAAMGLMLNIFDNAVQTMAFDDLQNVAYNLGGLSILSVAMLIGLLQLPSVAAGLGGGVAMGFIHEMKAVGGMGKAAASAGMGAMKGGAAAAAAGLSYNAARMSGAGRGEAAKAAAATGSKFLGRKAA